MELIGPIEATLTNKETGDVHVIDLWLCAQCKHPVNSEQGFCGARPEKVEGCTNSCKGCQCDTSN